MVVSSTRFCCPQNVSQPGVAVTRDEYTMHDAKQEFEQVHPYQHALMDAKVAAIRTSTYGHQNPHAVIP